MASSIPQFLLPRGFIRLRGQMRYLQRASPITSNSPGCRHASNTKPSKPIVLEKPARFNPPSHGRRLKEHLPRSYGPELTAQQRVQQQTKKYPNMFPPEGTFMYWFLTNRGIHIWITMGTLVLLASFTMFENWRKDSVFKDNLPAREELLSHPIRSVGKVWEAFKISTYENSRKVRQQRHDASDDVQKQNTWRKAHGIEDKQGLGPWLPAEEKLKLIDQFASKAPEDQEKVDEGGVEPQKKPVVKKWLGIW